MNRVSRKAKPKLQEPDMPLGKLDDKTGIMICGHGSRNQNAAKEFATLSEGLKARYPDAAIEYGYLEFCNPVIHAGLDALKAARREACARGSRYAVCCRSCQE